MRGRIYAGMVATNQVAEEKIPKIDSKMHSYLVMYERFANLVKFRIFNKYTQTTSISWQNDFECCCRCAKKTRDGIKQAFFLCTALVVVYPKGKCSPLLLFLWEGALIHSKSPIRVFYDE